ncbi:general negative regulator of transcription subunit 5 [Conglomerata obtusa]
MELLLPIMRKNNDIKKDEKPIKPTTTKSLTPTKQITTKPTTKDQNLTPAEVWAKATKLLNKSKESPKKEEKEKTFEFTEIEKKISKLESLNIKKSMDNGFIYRLDYEMLYNAEQFEPVEPIEQKYDFFPKKQLDEFGGFDIYRKVDLDVLFYVFYTRPGTMRQYYAAKELKNYSWRFHTKYRTWFQRLEEPKIITEEYEQGIFLFFDYDITWGNRKKKDFTFEYKYLENIEM